MAEKRWSLSVPMEGFSIAELGDIAREAERLGYTDAWSFEVDGVDGFTPLAAIGSATTSMRLGIAIANVYTRGPATLASTAAGLADLAPGRFVLGIGSGSQPIVESWNGGVFAKPATRVRETAQFLRAAASSAGRDPDAIEITARLFVNLDTPGPESDQIIRRHIAAYLNVPVYRAYQEWLGRTPVLQPMWDAWGAGDRKGAVAAIPPAVVEELIVRGPLPAMRARVQRYLDQGIDTAFLQFQTNDPDPARRRALMLDAMRGLAPSSRS